MSKKEDNQFIRMIFALIYGTILGSIGYIAKGNQGEFLTFILVACILSCSISLGWLAIIHKKNSDEIDD